jgi:hypothetical protein
MAKPTLALPDDPSPTATLTEKRIWEKEVDGYVRKKSYLDENLKTLYSLIWGQCTNVMRARVEALDNYEVMSSEGDSILLLKAIKSLVYNFQSQKYHPLAIYDGMRRFYMIYQEKHTSCQVYLEKFQNCVDVLEHCGGSVGHVAGLVNLTLADRDIDPNLATRAELTEAIKTTEDQYLATAFLAGADRSRYGKLIENLENDFTQGQDRYPKTLTAAYSLLTNWKQAVHKSLGPANDGMSFTNVDGDGNTEHSLNNNGRNSVSRLQWLKDKVNITCHKCQEKGHYANECNNVRVEKEAEATLVTAGASTVKVDDFDDADHVHFQFLMTGKHSDHRSVVLNQPAGAVPKLWILLDNQSTVDVFYNKELLQNIRKSETHMEIHCNAEVTSTNFVGDFPGYGTVWYHPNGIANILLLARVKEKHRVTFDSDGENQFVVHKSDGTTRCFKQSRRGLYFLEANNTSTVLVNTVEDNKSRYMNRDYSKATLARKVQNIIGRPSVRTYLHIVDNNLMPNCPITWKDIIVENTAKCHKKSS